MSEFEYKFIPTPKGKNLLMMHGYTYSQKNVSNNFYCSKKDAGCKARVALGKQGYVVKAFIEHNHEPPKYVLVAGRFLFVVLIGLLDGGSLWVKKYAQEIAKNRYRCNLCGVCIKLPGKSYNNLKRHFCRKHIEIFDKEEPKEKKPGPKRYVFGKPCVLKFCKNIAKDTYLCKLCGSALKSFGKSYGNLKRHFIRKHQEEYEQEEKKAIKGPLNIWIKKYFVEIDTNKHECLICTSIIKTPGKKYNNLRRHFKSKHPDIYKKEQNENLPVIKFSYVDNAESSSEFFIEYISSEDDDIDENVDVLLTNIKEHRTQMGNEINEKDTSLQEINKKSVGNIVSQEDLPEVDNEVFASTSEISVEYEAETSNNAAERSGSSQNKSLIETRKSKLEDSKTAIIPKYDERDEEKIKYLCRKPVKDSRFRTCFWNFFEEVQPDGTYACCFCLKPISTIPYKVSNLKRHICKVHMRAASFIFKYMPKGDSCRPSSDVEKESEFDKTYFEFRTENQSKCRLCSEEVSYTAKSELFQHLADKHPDEIISFEPDPLSIDN